MLLRSLTFHTIVKKKKKTKKDVNPPITLFKQAMKMTKICFPAQGRAADPSHAGRSVSLTTCFKCLAESGPCPT